MKCPTCRKESTKKERTGAGGKCPQCGWAFRFDPPAPLSDFEIAHAIDTVSRHGAHRYTRAQLVAEVERVLVKRTTRIYETEANLVVENAGSPLVWLVALALVIVGLVLLAVFQELCGTPLLVMAVGICIFRLFRRDPKLVAQELRDKIEPFDVRATSLVETYLRGEVPSLLVDAPTGEISRERSPRAPAREFDLESYGFDRVIVVQGDDVVDMLVKNQFHFQHNAAIVSFTGYPKHVSELVARQLEAGESEAKVFLLHDASDEGHRLAAVWRASPFAKNATLIEVGLTRAHAERLLPRRRPVRFDDGAVPEADRAFLGSTLVTLAALRPEQMMNLLYNAMSASDRGAVAGVGIQAADELEAVSDAAYDFG